MIYTRTNHKCGCPRCCNQKRRAKKRQQQSPVQESQHAMKYWDWAANQEAGLDPHKLTWGSGIRANWICHKCPKCQPHRWTAVVHTVCMTTTGCPSCLGQKACICNSLQSLHPETAAEWDSSRNEGTPDDYSAQSNKKVWWCTSKTGSFQAAISDRTQYNRSLKGASLTSRCGTTQAVLTDSTSHMTGTNKLNAEPPVLHGSRQCKCAFTLAAWRLCWSATVACHGCCPAAAFQSVLCIAGLKLKGT